MKIAETTIRPKALDDEYAELLSAEIKAFFLDPATSELKASIAVAVNCPACGRAGAAPYLVKDGFRLERCRVCEMVFVNPRPSERALIDFFSQSKAIDLYSEMVQLTSAARADLIFKPLAELITATYGKKGGRLLEVGCGSGLFLEAIAQQNTGWLLKGVEPSGRAVEICREKGLDVFHGSLEELDENQAYDLVVFWAVFDHFFDPAAITRKAYELLKPGGAILIGNMNIEGFDSIILGKENGVFSVPERQNFFGVKSMSEMLRRGGFSDVKVNTSGRLDVDIVKNYWTAGGREGRSRFLEKIVLGPPALQDAFQRFLTKNNLSGHMTVTASKSR